MALNDHVMRVRTMRRHECCWARTFCSIRECTVLRLFALCGARIPFVCVCVCVVICEWANATRARVSHSTRRQTYNQKFVIVIFIHHELNGHCPSQIHNVYLRICSMHRIRKLSHTSYIVAINIICNIKLSWGIIWKYIFGNFDYNCWWPLAASKLFIYLHNWCEFHSTLFSTSTSVCICWRAIIFAAAKVCTNQPTQQISM